MSPPLRDAPRTSSLRMILARLKDIDIAARPKGVDRVPDEEIIVPDEEIIVPDEEINVPDEELIVLYGEIAPPRATV